MGLDINIAQFLVTARKNGVPFDKTLMLGRHSLNVYPKTMSRLLEKNDLPVDKFRVAGDDCVYAEPFFESLGAKTVESLDYSNFEGAQHVHDLNQPLTGELKGQYDAVYDGGTLEHVFNFPTALRNSMELLKVGGRLFIHTGANNFCGHGFYQFSPELFYRALSPENGFVVERMIAHRVGPYGSWWEVADPQAVHSRIELITFTPIHLMIQARRTAMKEIFATTPQQSDYAVLWKKDSASEKLARPRFPRIARLFHALGTGIEFYRRQSLGNRRFFKVVKRT